MIAQEIQDPGCIEIIETLISNKNSTIYRVKLPIEYCVFNHLAALDTGVVIPIGFVDKNNKTYINPTKHERQNYIVSELFVIASKRPTEEEIKKWF